MKDDSSNTYFNQSEKVAISKVYFFQNKTIDSLDVEAH